jgi:integrase
VLPAFVVAALRRYRSEQRKRHLALGVGNLGPDAYVFDRFDGTIWHPNHVSQRFSRLVRRAKLPTIRFHDLRHGFASLSFAAGVPLKVVSESLGHSGIAITAQTYVHLLDDLKRDKSDRLDAYLDGVFDAPPTAGSKAS